MQSSRVGWLVGGSLYIDRDVMFWERCLSFASISLREGVTDEVGILPLVAQSCLTVNCLGGATVMHAVVKGCYMR
jgi:hypothetical protein